MIHEFLPLAKYAFALLAHYSGADALYRWLSGPSLAVLMYHRLRDDYDPAPLSTSPATFGHHVHWLRARRWLVSLEDGRATVDVRMGRLPTGGDRLPLAVGQVVLTVTSVPTVREVVLVADGARIEAPLPGGALTGRPLTAADYAVLRQAPSSG